jgi:uncharacterized protein (TIGR03083 family)
MIAPGPILVAPLFRPLDAELLALLRGLESDDWRKPTTCSEWDVKDVAAHLVDSAIRRLATQRDGHSLPFDASGGLASWINGMNQRWVEAARRMSPAMLIELLDLYGRQLSQWFETLDPFAPAAWSVSWAGEEESQNWFDMARELTERWHHQQQIRDATGRPALYTSRFFAPVIDTFMRALPYTYRDVPAPDGTTVRFEVTGEGEGTWDLHRDGSRWLLSCGGEANANTVVSMTGDTAWRLFTKGLDRRVAAERISIHGDRAYGQPVIQMLCIIA